MQFHAITLFPESFDSYINESIIGRAIKQKKIKMNFINPRMYVTGKYKKVWPDGNVQRIIDDKPYGGGPGMVMRAEPMIKAVEAAMKKISKRKNTKTLIVFLSPSGMMFDTKFAKTTAEQFTDVVFICGRYEGIDARVLMVLNKMKSKSVKIQEVSIGDYVLTGGELPAMVMIDCIARQIPGVLGNFDSREEERVSSSEFYTRPEILEWPNPTSRDASQGRVKTRKYKVPPVLLSGDHKKIEEWKTNK